MEHWGRLHERQNRFDAVFTIEPRRRPLENHPPGHRRSNADRGKNEASVGHVELFADTPGICRVGEVGLLRTVTTPRVQQSHQGIHGEAVACRRVVKLPLF